MPPSPRPSGRNRSPPELGRATTKSKSRSGRRCHPRRRHDTLVHVPMSLPFHRHPRTRTRQRPSPDTVAVADRLRRRPVAALPTPACLRPKRRLVVPLLAAALVLTAGCIAAGGLSTGGQLLTVRTAPGWSTQAMGQRFETRYRPTPTGPEVIGQSTVSPMTQLDFGAVRAVHQAVAAFAGEFGLTPTTPTAAERRAGWLTAYVHPDGTRVSVRDDELGRWVEVHVRGGRSSSSLARELALRLGVTSASPTSAASTSPAAGARDAPRPLRAASPTPPPAPAAPPASRR